MWQGMITPTQAELRNNVAKLRMLHQIALSSKGAGEIYTYARQMLPSVISFMENLLVNEKKGVA